MGTLLEQIKNNETEQVKGNTMDTGQETISIKQETETQLVTLTEKPAAYI